jgi:hypothetical protein
MKSLDIKDGDVYSALRKFVVFSSWTDRGYEPCCALRIYAKNNKTILEIVKC